MDSRQIYSAVSERYSALSSTSSPLNAGYGKSVAQSFGYTEEALASIPAESNLGLSCGNPLAIASLREGETVIDLGSGAGFDIFLAAKKVGLTGRAIGVDMNKDMIVLANKNKTKAGTANVEFIEAQITKTPLENNIGDAIISNCVINLVPGEEKQLVFNEMFRILKPGGRVAVSDILAKKPLPEQLKKSIVAYVGCVAGASLVSQYETYFQEAGFADVLISNVQADLNVYLDTLPDGTKRVSKAESDDQQKSSCCASAPIDGAARRSQGDKTSGCGANQQRADGCCAKPASASEAELDLEKLFAQLGNVDLNEWVGSYKIFAVKP